MPFIGNKPSAVPLTSADITDSIITSAKIVDATITNSDVASSIITGQTAETSIAGGDSVLIYDDSASALRKMTRTNFVAGVGGTNTPAFSAKMSSGQDIGYTGVWTKLNFTSEQFDIGSYYDATNAKFTPPSGKYFVYYSIYFYGTTGNTLSALYSTIYKNGTDNAIFRGRFQKGGQDIGSITLKGGAVIELNGTDYLEIYAQSNNVSAGSTNADDVSSVFGAFKIIE